MIKKEEVIDFQKKWANGIIRIGSLHLYNQDYKQEAINFVSEMYAYDSDMVLFKPTLASEFQFRLTKDSAISYFIGGNKDYLEDVGFALLDWSEIRWENAGINIINDIAICMGNYFPKKVNEEEIKIEFSLVLKKINGNEKLIMHGSHFPYSKL